MLPLYHQSAIKNGQTILPFEVNISYRDHIYTFVVVILGTKVEIVTTSYLD